MVPLLTEISFYITKATAVLAGDWLSDLIAEFDAMLPQKSGTLPVLQTSPSDSRIVSSTHGLLNSSLRTSSSTRPSTSCRCCEDCPALGEFPVVLMGPLFFQNPLFFVGVQRSLWSLFEPLRHPQE